MADGEDAFFVREAVGAAVVRDRTGHGDGAEGAVVYEG
jgi:hypothetical protein